MKRSWSETRDSWLRDNSLADEISLWALDAINRKEKEVYELESSFQGERISTQEQKLKLLKKLIKQEIVSKENELDNLTLNSPNSYKLQVSVPSSLNYLMKAWAAAEGRDLSSIALQCLEIGLRALRSKGSIPTAAIQRYDDVCEKKIALAEINNIWEEHLEFNYKTEDN